MHFTGQYLTALTSKEEQFCLNFKTEHTLHNFALHCNELHCTDLHCTSLHCTELNYTTLGYLVLHLRLNVLFIISLTQNVLEF